MTEESKRQFDQIIDALHLEQATGKSREELHRIVAVVAVEMDLCVVLADVTDSLMIDIDDALRLIKVPQMVEDRDRSNIKELRKHIRAARKYAWQMTRDTVHSDRDTDMAVESDWWKNLILLVEDRTGEDELKTKQVIQWLTTMPSILGLFNIRTKDFKRLTDENEQNDTEI